MSNFRILETSYNLPDVLIRRHRDEDGNEYVVIEAFGLIDGEENMTCSEEVLFENAEAAQDFIRSYPHNSAEKFCNRQKVKYQ